MLTIYGLYGRFLVSGFVGTQHSSLWPLQHDFCEKLAMHPATDMATPAMYRMFFKLDNRLDKRNPMSIDVP